MNGLSQPKFNILGMELAGVVEAVGAHVTRFRVGDEVFGLAGTKFGAHAEYVCVAAGKNLERKPSNLSFEEAAPLSYAGVTALHFLRPALSSRSDRGGPQIFRERAQGGECGGGCDRLTPWSAGVLSDLSQT